MKIRKTLLIQEKVHSENFGTECDTIIRVAALSVVKNPLAGSFTENLSELFDTGGYLGETLMHQAVRLLGKAPISYGKAAIIGSNGDLEHGSALIHPKLGKPMREAVGGGWWKTAPKSRERSDYELNRQSAFQAAVSIRLS